MQYTEPHVAVQSWAVGPDAKGPVHIFPPRSSTWTVGAMIQTTDTAIKRRRCQSDSCRVDQQSSVMFHLFSLCDTLWCFFLFTAVMCLLWHLVGVADVWSQHCRLLAWVFKRHTVSRCHNDAVCRSLCFWWSDTVTMEYVLWPCVWGSELRRSPFMFLCTESKCLSVCDNLTPTSTKEYAMSPMWGWHPKICVHGCVQPHKRLQHHFVLFRTSTLKVFNEDTWRVCVLESLFKLIVSFNLFDQYW